MSLSLVIASFSTGTYTVTRTAADSYAAGIRTPGATSTFSIDASVQPVSGNDLRAVPEGRRVDDFRTLWTRTALILTPNPDQVSIGGEVFEVFRAPAFGILEPTFYRVMVTRRVVP